MLLMLIQTDMYTHCHTRTTPVDMHDWRDVKVR